MNGNQNQYGSVISQTKEHLKKELEQFMFFIEQKEQCHTSLNATLETEIAHLWSKP